MSKRGRKLTRTLQYVYSCPKQPAPNMAFCVEHCEMAKKQQIPIELHYYLKYIYTVTASSLLYSELDSIVKMSANNVTKSYVDSEDRGQDNDNEKICSPPHK